MTMTNALPSLSLPLPLPNKDDPPQHVYTVSDLHDIKPLLSTTITHPAIIVPSKLTSSLRSTLKPVLMNRPKLKDVYPLDLPRDSIDGSADLSSSSSSITNDYNMERKIVLKRHVDLHDNEDDDDEKEEEEDLDDTEIVLKENCNRGNDKEDTQNDMIYNHPLIQNLLNDPAYAYPIIRKSTHDVTIGYEHYSVDQVLSKILPKDLHEIPSSFEVVGHLAHITLREEYYPYKYIIGRVILDKNKGIQVVVNKTGTIQNEFRTFPMEILADDRPTQKNNPLQKHSTTSNANDMNLWVEVKEDGCRFQLDFEKVYWNSRLQYEHKRIVHLIAGKPRPFNVEKRQQQQQPKQEQTQQQQEKTTNNNSVQGTKIIVADACAGIGPFAIPLTSQYDHVEVHANDLNPESYKYLNINAKLNKCNHHEKDMPKLYTYNMDARYFIRMLEEKGIAYDYVILNLPAIAPEFLNVFRGWKGHHHHHHHDDGRPHHSRPIVYVHCFAAKVGGEVEAVERCGRSLGCCLDWERDEVSVHTVRNVSPKKNMYCVSFRLPEAVQDLERVKEFGPVVALEAEEDEQEILPLDKTAEENQRCENQEEDDKDDDEPCTKKSRIVTS